MAAARKGGGIRKWPSGVIHDQTTLPACDMFRSQGGHPASGRRTRDSVYNYVMNATVIEPRPGVDMGRVVVPIIVENRSDIERAERGEISAAQVRRVTLNALVDTGATFLCLPEAVILQLGLSFRRARIIRTANDHVTRSIYGAAALKVQGRECDAEVMNLEGRDHALLGQIPLETMDWWVDLTNKRPVGNPEHGGQEMAEA